MLNDEWTPSKASGPKDGGIAGSTVARVRFTPRETVFPYASNTFGYGNRGETLTNLETALP